jgi:hypothetical protein
LLGEVLAISNFFEGLVLLYQGGVYFSGLDRSHVENFEVFDVVFFVGLSEGFFVGFFVIYFLNDGLEICQANMIRINWIML